MKKIILFCLLLSFFFLSGCNQYTVDLGTIEQLNAYCVEQGCNSFDSFGSSADYGKITKLNIVCGGCINSHYSYDNFCVIGG